MSASQTIDYDDGAAEDLKFVTEKVKEIEHEKVLKKLEVSSYLLSLVMYFLQSL